MANNQNKYKYYTQIRQRKQNSDLGKRLTYHYIVKHNEKNKEQKAPSKGARAIFLEKYKQEQNFELAKQELSDNGFTPEVFGDEVLKKWIDEGR